MAVNFSGTSAFQPRRSYQSINKDYTYSIPETTQARANVRAALKESRRTEDNEKDYLRLVKLMEEYLPHIRGIMNCVAHDEIGFKNEPTFSWRTTLSANFFKTSPRLSLPGLHADYAFTLLTYAFALSNLAWSIVGGLGVYEHDRAISDVSRRMKDEQLNVAVGFLCKSSGIFSHIGDTVLPGWEINQTGGPSGFNKPPELLHEVNTALAKMVLADAQTLATRKLLSKSAFDNNIAPGPPLPKSHPSPSLLAKLHLECGSLYASARSLAKTPGASKGFDNTTEIATDLRKYLSDEASFHNALAHKWLGIHAGENGGTDQGGEAVAFLGWAKKELEDLKDSAKGVTIGKSDKGREKRKEKVAEELSAVNIFFKHYKKMNDSLHFQPVPAQVDLQNRIPTGTMAIAARPFVPPTPAFGPGSVEYTRKQAERMQIGTEPGHNESSTEIDADPPGTDSYAGAGAYF